MNKFFTWMFGWLSICLAFLNTSCSKDANQTAMLQVRLTDAPGDYEEVNVDIKEIQIQGKDSTGSNSGWKSVASNPGVYNLLDFTNGRDTLVASAEIPTGKISQIRLVLGSNNTVKINGQSYNLATPSAQQSGLKISVNATLTAGIVYNIVLDFDAARSIVTTGNSNYILKPVIRSVAAAESGAVSGMVTPTASTPVVYAIQGSDTVASSAAGSTGNFLLGGLPAGTYNIFFRPKTGYDTLTKHNVAVTIGNVTNIGTIQIVQH